MSFANQESNPGGLKMHSYGYLPPLPVVPEGLKHLYGHVSASQGLSGISFSDTLGQMIGRANNAMAQPEKLSIEAVRTGKVDIHEVMIAMGKADVSFKMITAVSQKIVGAFDKLTSMQI